MSVMPSEPLPDEARDSLLGTRIDGRYLVERVHVRGGMSVIYAALHEQQQREVAVKVLDESFVEDFDAVERFIREARVASSLSHGHVVGVSDSGSLPDGRPYLVMPLIAGTDMATLLGKEGPLAPKRVAALLGGVASALDALHAKGLVHRDIKSENLMHIRGDDGKETALLLDFGIAAADPLVERGWLEPSGTPEFMAPEVLAGGASEPASDVYALATVAFELITGSLPFEGEDLPALLRAKSKSLLPTLADITNTSFPEAVEDVVARGLAREQWKRQRSAGQFVSELATAAAQMSEPSVKPLPQPRVPRPRTLVGPLATARMELPRAQGRESRRRKTELAWQTSKRPSVAEIAPQASKPASVPEIAPQTSKPASVPVAPPPPLGLLPSASQPPPAASSGPKADAKKPEISSKPAKSATAPAKPTAEPAKVAPASTVAPPSTAAPESTVTPPSTVAPAVTLAPASPVAEPKVAAPPSLPSIIVDPSLQPRSEDDTLRPPPELEREIDLDLTPIRSRVLEPRHLLLAGAAALLVLGLVVLRRPSAPHAAPAVPYTAATTTAEAAPSEPARPEPAAAPAPVAAEAVPPPAPERAALHAEPEEKAGREAAPTPARPAAPKVARARSAPAKPAPATRSAPQPQHVAARADKSADRGRAADLAQTATDAMLRGDFEAAKSAYQQALTADPDYAPAYRGQGLVLEHLGRTKDAARAFRQFLRLRPNDRGADKIRARLDALEGGH